jgi:hypothetical protein
MLRLKKKHLRQKSYTYEAFPISPPFSAGAPKEKVKTSPQVIHDVELFGNNYLAVSIRS